MTKLNELRDALDDQWIPAMYEKKVRSQRTRSLGMAVPARENSPEIFHTLLGIELKVGKTRIACPDLATARYLCVFARLGCVEIAVPYDISKISRIADDLETAWQRMNLFLRDAKPRARSVIIRAIREEISEIGAGELMPEFKQSTKQRRA
jgi:hypothetical protein